MKRVLIIITIASVLLVLVIAGPFLVKAICILLVLLTLLGDIIRRTYKIDKHKFSRPQQGNRQEQHNNGIQNEEVHGKKKLISVRVSDAIFFVLLFIIAPLATLFLFTLFTPAGRQLFPDGLSDPAAWWNFWIAFQEAAAKLLGLWKAVKKSDDREMDGDWKWKEFQIYSCFAHGAGLFFYAAC